MESLNLINIVGTFSCSTQTAIISIGNLTTLDIEEITKNLKLENIDVSQNEIKIIDNPRILMNHTRLKSLNLNSNNELEAQKNGIFLESNSLEVLLCKMCGFSEIWAETLSGLPDLKKLDLSFNQLKSISEQAFVENLELTSLDLRNNKIQEITVDLVKDLLKFTELFLSNNPIKFGKKQAILKSPSLKILHCEYCEIQEIYDSSFSELKSLEELNFNHNFIEILPNDSFKSNEKLKSLTLEHNQLKTFPTVVIEYLKQLEELCIDDNEFVMSKEILELIEIYNKRTLRSDTCTNQNFQEFFEFQSKDITTTSTTEQPDKSSFIPRFINQGISDLFIGSYLTFIIIIQVAVFAMLSIYLIKIVKYESVDGEMDYSTTILNENDIYKVYKSRD